MLSKVQDVLEVIPRMNPVLIHPVHGHRFLKIVFNLIKGSLDEQRIWYGPFPGRCFQS